MNNNRIDDNRDEVIENIKTNLVKLRTANELSKRDVAAALGINENTYRIWEDPKRSSPKMHNIVKIAMIYGVSVDFLLTNHTWDTPEPANTFHCDDEEKKKYMSTLDKYEKLIVMKIRQLDPKEKEKIGAYIEELLNEQD